MKFEEWLENNYGTSVSVQEFGRTDMKNAFYAGQNSIPAETLVSPQCDHIVGVMPNDKPYYVKGDIRWTCSSDIKNATSEEKEFYEKKLAKFKYCPICGEALSV